MSVFDISTQFPQWDNYIWKSKIKKIISTKPSYTFDQHMALQPTVTFMVFKLKLTAFPIKLTPNDPNQGKKL